jgi:hypothetical protein
MSHHLVNVFCWTLTHCCSSGAMFAGCAHQCCQKGAQYAGRNKRLVMQCRMCSAGWCCVLAAVFLAPNSRGMRAWLVVALAGADSAVHCGAPGNRSKLAPAGPCGTSRWPDVLHQHQTLVQSQQRYTQAFPDWCTAQTHPRLQVTCPVCMTNEQA